MGASTIAVHLAVQMRAGGEGRILLVDADPMTASIGFMLKLKSEFHFGDVLRDWKRMDEDLWSRLIVHFSGIDVLLAPETPMPHFLIDRPLAEEICHFWRDRYETVVVDMPDLRTAVESGLCALADQIFLVTTNELAALHASRRALEVLDLSVGDRARLRLIVNRYNPAAGLRREDLKTALQFEPFAVLSNDYQTVQDALLDGKPAGSGSRFRGSIQALCDQLRGRPGPAKKNGSWLGFLHRTNRPE
jgi:pilus assembly protein CpaE